MSTYRHLLTLFERELHGAELRRGWEDIWDLHQRFPTQETATTHIRGINQSELTSVPRCFPAEHPRCKGPCLNHPQLPRTPPYERMPDRASMCGLLSLRAPQRERKPRLPPRLPRCDVGKPFDGVYPPQGPVLFAVRSILVMDH